MKTLIIAGGEMSPKEMEKYSKEYRRTKHNCCR